MREIYFMTWNTQLYEMGNKLNIKQAVKEINNQTFEIVINKVKDFLDSEKEAIAVLQEIPFKCNNEEFKEHIFFYNFLKSFPENEYDRLYNICSKKQIKMTVVLAKKKGQEELVYKKNTH